MREEKKELTLHLSLTPAEARAFAQFLKRAAHDDYLRQAQGEEEAILMRAAGDELKKALAQAGIAPR